LFLFLDYDGTLTDIASTPEAAVLPGETRELLLRLAGLDMCRMAVISGRSIGDIKNKVGVDGIVYAGNHGLEVEGPGIKRSIAVSQSEKDCIKEVKAELENIVLGFEGGVIEDKGLSISVHFRLIKLPELPKFLKRVQTALSPYILRNKIRLSNGKMVYDIRPAVLWDKGSVVLWIIDKWQSQGNDQDAVLSYFGDDATDEDAFKVLKKNSLTVFVGKPQQTAARYYLNNPQEVRGFLGEVCEFYDRKG